MARVAHTINNRGKILQFIADKYPILEHIMILSQLWSFHIPIVEIPKSSLENTLFGPAIVRNVVLSQSLLSVISQAKRKWNDAKTEDLMVFKRLEMVETNIYVGLKPEVCPQLTPFICFSARNHKFIGRLKISVCMPSSNLTYPESVEEASPPYNLNSRNPPLIATILECIDKRSNSPEWDDSLFIKLALHNDLMSIFSFNRNQRFGEGSVLHPFRTDANYSDNVTITPINGHQYHLDFVHDEEGNKLSIYDFMFGDQITEKLVCTKYD